MHGAAARRGDGGRRHRHRSEVEAVRAHAGGDAAHVHQLQVLVAGVAVRGRVLALEGVVERGVVGERIARERKRELGRLPA